MFKAVLFLRAIDKDSPLTIEHILSSGKTRSSLDGMSGNSNKRLS